MTSRLETKLLLAGLEPNRREYPCNVDNVLKELEEADRKILQDALDDPKKWSPYGLHHALKLRGIKLNDKAILKHRSGECSC